MLVLISIIVCINLVIGSVLSGRDVSHEALQGTYKKIVDDLVAVKKKFPDSQATVYGVIDQVGQMHEIASESIKKYSDLNKKVNDQEKKLAANKNKDLECTALQNEITSLKNDLTAANQKLVVVEESKKVLVEDQKKQKDLAKLVKKEEAKLIAGN